MTERKGPKQASISAFFSPQKADADQRAAEIEAAVAAAAAAAEAKKAQEQSKEAEEKEQETAEKKEEKPASKKKEKKPRARARAKGKAKSKASPKPKKEKKKQRFVSPHAMLPDDDDEFDDDEDVFNTPEGKKAREELEKVQAAAAAEDAALDAEEGEAEERGATEEKSPAEEMVDLTAASDVKDSEEAKPTGNGAAKKTRGKKAATSPSKTSVRAPTKRKQKMKEKADVAVAEAKPAPMEPLDPITQARVDAYQLKTDELTRQYTELLHSKNDSDVVMQEIYGVALDRDLDVIVDHDKVHQALVDTWQKLREHSQGATDTVDAATAPSTVEFPHEVKCLIVKGIQGRASSLSVLARELVASFRKGVASDDVDMETDSHTDKVDSADAVDRAAVVVVEMEIKMLAQRTPHGVRPPKANLFEDTSADALWVWEVGSLDKYFDDEAQKTIKRMRKNRKRLGQQIKTLTRVLQLLHKKPVDEVKISSEEAKVGKFGLVVDAELQKAKERESKEQEKLHAAEEKKRHELERQQAKEDEKRKREREDEEKKEESAKRRKSLVSYFRSIDTETAIAIGAGTSDSAIDMTGDKEEKTDITTVEGTEEVMARIDAAIGFLGSNDGAPSSSISAAGGASQSIFSSLKNKRDATKKRPDKQFSKAWSARRHRDPKLGVMKLLQFYDNNRPAYNGTFSKRSRIFRRGRRPFAQYAKFDYSVDSDDEWEEEEPGESLSDADSDGEESDEDNLDYGDQWLAYEDEVDYMDDVEEEDDPMDGGERRSSPTKHKLPSQLQKKRVKAKGIKPAKLEPQIVGPIWCTHSGNDACVDDHFSGCAGERLCEPAVESTLMRKAREYEEQERLRAEREVQQKLKEEQKRKEQEQQKLKQQALEKQKAASAPAKTAVEKTTPQKSQKAQKAPKSAAKHPSGSPSSGPAKPAASISASASTPATPSPANPTKPIDAFFKKVSGPVVAPPQASGQPQVQQKQEAPKKASSVEVISVD